MKLSQSGFALVVVVWYPMMDSPLFMNFLVSDIWVGLLFCYFKQRWSEHCCIYILTVCTDITIG